MAWSCHSHIWAKKKGSFSLRTWSNQFTCESRVRHKFDKTELMGLFWVIQDQTLGFILSPDLIWVTLEHLLVLQSRLEHWLWVLGRFIFESLSPIGLLALNWTDFTSLLLCSPNSQKCQSIISPTYHCDFELVFNSCYCPIISSPHADFFKSASGIHLSLVSTTSWGISSDFVQPRLLHKWT